MDENGDRSGITGMGAGLGFGLIALALCRKNGRYDDVALVLVLAAWIVLIAAAWLPIRPGLALKQALMPMLGGLLGIGLYGASHLDPALYTLYRVAPLGRWLVLGAVAAVALSYRVKLKPLAPWRFPVLLGAYLLMGSWVIFATPSPHIDVWTFTQQADHLLLHGHNPYDALYDNIYLPRHDRFYGPNLSPDGRIYSYPYPPLTLLMSLPGYVLGDVRWSMLLAVAGAGALMVATIRRMGVRPGDPAELGAALMLFHPRAFFMVEQSWTEAYLALLASATIWAMTISAPRMLPAALGMLVSAKQYVFFWLPALIHTGRLAPRTLGRAAAWGVAIALPFLLWNPAALVKGVLLGPAQYPFRPDALSALVWMGTSPPGLGIVEALLVACLLCLLPASSRLSTACLRGAATLVAFFVFHTQAFLNYYWFAQMLLALAISLSLAEATNDAPAAPG